MTLLCSNNRDADNKWRLYCILFFVYCTLDINTLYICLYVTQNNCNFLTIIETKYIKILIKHNILLFLSKNILLDSIFVCSKNVQRIKIRQKSHFEC